MKERIRRETKENKEGSNAGEEEKEEENRLERKTWEKEVDKYKEEDKGTGRKENR